MMQPWFNEAKLGIFLHWGLYAVNGIPESWSFYNREISYADYMAQAQGFTAAQYDPDAWADLFARAGARYVVLTTKHHDGFALWDTRLSPLNAVSGSAAGRDLIGPYVQALRRRDLKVGLYFSHLDWSHPDYEPVPVGERHPDTESWAGWPDGADTPAWRRFLAFHRGQLQELSEAYRPDHWFFDGEWAPPRAWWDFDGLHRQLLEWLPEVVMNSRVGGLGDYASPEQGVPIIAPTGPWEFCFTLNDSWGWQGRDTHYKSVRQIVRMFAETIGMGGNVLLGIGPRADGTLAPEQVERLEALGRWTCKHAEAIYPTGAGLPPGHFYGASTLSQDAATLYLFFFDRPRDQIAVKGIRNAVKRITVVGGDGAELTCDKVGGAPWPDAAPPVLWIDVPESALDENASVLKIELDGPRSLYRGSGGAIEKN